MTDTTAKDVWRNLPDYHGKTIEFPDYHGRPVTGVVTDATLLTGPAVALTVDGRVRAVFATTIVKVVQ